MSLLKLIDNLDSSTKTELLGEETTKILKYTFSESINDVIDKSIINNAIAIQLGAKLVVNKIYRKLLVDFCKLSEIKKHGYLNFEEANLAYAKDINKFINDFNIEDEYLFEEEADNRKSHEFIIPVFGECNGIMSFPHEYQKTLKDKLFNILLNKINPIVLTIMPTGSGKTVLAMELINDYFRSAEVIFGKKIKIAWIVKSRELCEQSLKSFQKIWKQKGDHKVVCERYFGKFNTIENFNESKITFASFDLLTSRIESYEVKTFLKELDLLIIDEAHYSEAETYVEVLTSYKALNNNYKIIGLTATPHRSDDDNFKTFKNNFNFTQTITDAAGDEIKSPIQHLINNGYLSKINFNILDVSEGVVSRTEYYRTLHNSVLNECNNILKNNENTIIFAQSKSHAVALSIFLRQNNIKNGLIVGETPDSIRKKLLENFGDNQSDLNILINHQILSTGIDVPGMNSIIVLSEINSPSLALQILGRAMRGKKNGGNEENKIFLTKENYKKLSEYHLLESIVLNN